MKARRRDDTTPADVTHPIMLGASLNNAWSTRPCARDPPALVPRKLPAL